MKIKFILNPNSLNICAAACDGMEIKMELIVINENKLKIMLNSNEMQNYGIDENEFYCSVSQTRKILGKILEDSPIKTGFEMENSPEKLLIQLYPDIAGGCEMFVTKLPILDFSEGDMANSEGAGIVRAVKKPNASKQLTLTYRFENIENAICACREIKARCLKSESDLYRGSGGEYYLLITAKQGENEKSSPSSFLSEFGELEGTERTTLFLLENGKCICKKDAVENLSKL